jgi:ketosteroid isomerase-like protein
MTTKEAVMTTQEVANRFSELVKENKWTEIQIELYADDAVSIEPPHAAAQGLQNAEGLDAIKKKGEEWNKMIEEMHDGWCSEAVIAGNHFSVGMGMDVTMKGAGRMQMDEIAVYEVKDGKIVKEQFFF